MHTKFHIYGLTRKITLWSTTLECKSLLSKVVSLSFYGYNILPTLTIDVVTLDINDKLGNKFKPILLLNL